MARRSKDLIALEEIDKRIADEEKAGNDAANDERDAEALLQSFDDRRDQAVTQRRLGEDVQVPDDDEPRRLQEAAARARRERKDCERTKQVLEDRRKPLVAAAVGDLEAIAEDSARALVNKCAQMLTDARALHELQEEKRKAWMTVGEGWRQLGREGFPGVGGAPVEDIEKAVKALARGAYPGNSEAHWREVRTRSAFAHAVRAEGDAQRSDSQGLPYTYEFEEVNPCGTGLDMRCRDRCAGASAQCNDHRKRQDDAHMPQSLFDWPHCRRFRQEIVSDLYARSRASSLGEQRSRSVRHDAARAWHGRGLGARRRSVLGQGTGARRADRGWPRHSDAGGRRARCAARVTQPDRASRSFPVFALRISTSKDI